MQGYKKFIHSIIALPNTVYNKAVLIYRGVIYGKGLKINGRIYLVGKKGHIIMGDNVHINSSLSSNPIGGDTRTIIFASPNAQIRIGNNVGISNASIVSHTSIEIEDNVLIGGSVKIYDTDFHSLQYSERISEPQKSESKPIRIKKGAFIGAHTVILKGVIVGEKSVVGAGSLVTKEIPDGEVWGGNPAKFIKKVPLE